MVQTWIKENKRMIILSLVIVLIICTVLLLPRLYEYRQYHNGIITYNNRDYRLSTVQSMDAAMVAEFGDTVPTGVYIFGNQVYDLPDDGLTSTVIFLKTKDDNVRIYALMGGP